MAVSTKIAPPNSIVLLSDFSDKIIPKSMNGSVIAATDSCIAVGCLSEFDGETTFTLALASEIDRSDPPSYEGMLRTPNHRVTMHSVFGQKLLEMPTQQEMTKLKIWINDPNEPDEVFFGIE
jgi:hypothetical protein